MYVILARSEYAVARYSVVHAGEAKNFSAGVPNFPRNKPPDFTQYGSEGSHSTNKFTIQTAERNSLYVQD
jgi:hypothetical protein